MPTRARTLLWSVVVLLATAQGVGAQTLTLDSALQTAFANNPDLAAAQWEIDIAGGGRQQAGLIPNPVASWDAEDTRRDTRTTTIKLSQTLELGGKRGARIDLATRAQDAAALTLEQRRNTLRVEVIDSYYGALRAQERLDLAQRSLALAERGLVVANGRVTAGKSSPVEATRAQAQVSEIRLELNRAQIGLTDAYRRLASSTGSVGFTWLNNRDASSAAPGPRSSSVRTCGSSVATWSVMPARLRAQLRSESAVFA